MPEAFVLIVAKVDKREATNLLQPDGNALARCAHLVRSIDGSLPASKCAFAILDDSGTKPQGSIGCTAAQVSDGNTVTFTLFGTTRVLTVGQEIELGATDTALGDALVAAIAADRYLRNFLKASNNAGLVTITFDFPGAIGESLGLTTNNALAFDITAMGTTTAGVDADATFFPQGKNNGA